MRQLLLNRICSVFKLVIVIKQQSKKWRDGQLWRQRPFLWICVMVIVCSSVSKLNRNWFFLLFSFVFKEVNHAGIFYLFSTQTDVSLSQFAPMMQICVTPTHILTLTFFAVEPPLKFSMHPVWTHFWIWNVYHSYVITNIFWSDKDYFSE